MTEDIYKANEKIYKGIQGYYSASPTGHNIDIIKKYYYEQENYKPTYSYAKIYLGKPEAVHNMNAVNYVLTEIIQDLGSSLKLGNNNERRPIPEDKIEEFINILPNLEVISQVIDDSRIYYYRYCLINNKTNDVLSTYSISYYVHEWVKLHKNGRLINKRIKTSGSSYNPTPLTIANFLLLDAAGNAEKVQLDIIKNSD